MFQEVLVGNSALLEVRGHEQINRLKGYGFRVIDDGFVQSVVGLVMLGIAHILVVGLDIG